MRTAEMGLGRRVARGVRLVWLNAAILFTLVAGIELLSFAYSAVRPLLEENEFAAMAQETPDDAYPDRSWLEAYYRELEGPGLRLRWMPYVYWRRVASQGAFINVDDNGIRRTWNQEREGGDAGAVRVAVFGGSAAWGTGARDDFTIPSYLSKALARQYPYRFHVTNYGEIGYVSTQSVMTLFREIQTGRIPDIVIFYEGYNDTFSAYQNGVAGIPMNESHRREEFNVLNGSRSLDIYKAALRRTYSYALVQDVRGRLRTKATAPVGAPVSQTAPQALARGVVDAYTRNMELVSSMAATWHFASRFYWQPTVWTKPKKTSSESTIEADAGPWGAFYRETMSSLDRSALAAGHLDFVNLSGVLDGIEHTTFIDDVHTTEIANERIANQIVANLQSVFAERAARHP